MSDARVLDAIAREMGIELAAGDVAKVRSELAALARMPLPSTSAPARSKRDPSVLGASAPHVAAGPRPSARPAARPCWRPGTI